MTVAPTKKSEADDSPSGLRYVQINLPFNFTGSIPKVENPQAPAVHLHYYQVVPGAAFPPLPVRIPTPEPPYDDPYDEPFELQEPEKNPSVLILHQAEKPLLEDDAYSSRSKEYPAPGELKDEQTGSEERPIAVSPERNSLDQQPDTLTPIWEQENERLTKEETYLLALDTVREEISEWNPFGSPALEPASPMSSIAPSKLVLEPGPKRKSSPEPVPKTNPKPAQKPKPVVKPAAKREIVENKKSPEESEKLTLKESKEQSSKETTKQDEEEPKDEDNEEDEEKMIAERKRLVARMNKRRAARQKRNKKRKAKAAEQKSADGKNQPAKAPSENSKKEPQMKGKGRPNSKVITKKKSGSEQTPSPFSSPPVNSLKSPTDMLAAQAQMWNQMPEQFLEQIQLLTQRLARVESNRGSGDFKEQGGNQFSMEPMLSRSMTYQGQNRMMQPNHPAHRTLSNIELMSKTELGRIQEEAAITTASQAKGAKKVKGKKRRRERIKSYDGKMIPVNIATGDELVDKLSMVVYFHGAKGKGQSPLVITVDKDWNFKKCIRKAIADMQKRPETTLNEELNWILHYDVNSQEGIKAIRKDLRVLMGDHRIEHRGSNLNHKPADYTNQFVNKLWIIPNKGIKLPSGPPRNSIARKSRIMMPRDSSRDSMVLLENLANGKYNL